MTLASNGERILGVRNLHGGETGILWLNGPSLREIPVDVLTAWPSFGVNRIWKCSDLVPDYYVAIDPPNYTEEAVDHLEWTTKFLNTPRLDLWPDDGLVIRWKQVEDGPPMGDLMHGLPIQGVAEAALQIMGWMGFKRVYLAGADGGDPQRHFYADYYPDNTASHGVHQSWEKALGRVRVWGLDVINLTPETKYLSVPTADWRKVAR